MLVPHCSTPVNPNTKYRIVWVSHDRGSELEFHLQAWCKPTARAEVPSMLMETGVSARPRDTAKVQAQEVKSCVIPSFGHHPKDKMKRTGLTWYIAISISLLPVLVVFSPLLNPSHLTVSELKVTWGKENNVSRRTARQGSSAKAPVLKFPRSSCQQLYWKKAILQRNWKMGQVLQFGRKGLIIPGSILNLSDLAVSGMEGSAGQVTCY